MTHILHIQTSFSDPQTNTGFIPLIIVLGRIVKDDVAAAVMKFCSWNASDSITTIDTETLKEQLCMLGSYRSLQKRLHTWFRAG